MLSGPAKATIVVSSVFPVLAILAVAARCYARRLKSMLFQADDYLIMLALLVVVASCATYIVGAGIGGIGVHMEKLTHKQFTMFNKIIFAVQFTYLAAVALIKLSILLFYRRIFTTSKFRMAVIVMSIFVIAWFISFFFATLFQVLPISQNWTYGPGKMINEFAMYTSTAVIEMVLDIATLVMPWPVIWKLQMDTHRKWVVCGIFMLGGFVCVSSIVRLYYLVEFLNPSVQQTEDFTYALANIIIWSAIEPCAGVICTCLPTLGPIFQGTSPESLVGSVWSVITIRSFRSKGVRDTQATELKKTANRSDDSMSRPFYPMHDYISTAANAGGNATRNVEKQY